MVKRTWGRASEAAARARMYVEDILADYPNDDAVNTLSDNVNELVITIDKFLSYYYNLDWANQLVTAVDGLVPSNAATAAAAADAVTLNARQRMERRGGGRPTLRNAGPRGRHDGFGRSEVCVRGVLRSMGGCVKELVGRPNGCAARFAGGGGGDGGGGRPASITASVVSREGECEDGPNVRRVPSTGH